MLLNSLNSISLFFFSFYRSQRIIIKEIINIQGDFLWKGEENKRIVNWISWSSLCKPKSEGGLCIKHCETFNTTFLRKWAWIIIDSKHSILTPLLSFKYRNIKGQLMDPSWAASNKKSSLWWRNFRGALSTWGIKEGWFNNCISCKLVQGSNIEFWRNRWFGIHSFSTIYTIYVLIMSRVLDSNFRTQVCGAMVSGPRFLTLTWYKLETRENSSI